MKQKLIEHCASIVVVSVLFAVAIGMVAGRNGPRPAPAAVAPYLGMTFIDFGDPAQTALFRATLNVYYPRSPGRNDSLLAAIEAYRLTVFADPAYKTGGEDRGLTQAALVRIGGMFMVFTLVFGVVLALSYYGARTLALYRFITMKQHAGSFLAIAMREFRTALGTKDPPLRIAALGRAALALAESAVKGAGLVILFSPAYVIAYSVRTRFDTDSVLFMIILGVLSNGLLINYANRFYTFLLAESRRGYVETAVVKNLRSSYAWRREDGLPVRALFRPASLLPTHVLHHIYLNARYQALPSIKELASFLITGLVIIEMALNIQGHLCYELLQTILYKQYDVALAIILGIFLLVKATEISVDLYCNREALRYENRS